MKRGVFAVICVIILSFGIGTAVYAAEVFPSTFKEMLPFMKERHPNMGDSELEQMYKSCHQEDGISNTRGMM
ncbi:hypothetical protein MHH52_19130 [Paenibacillus sp. FSL K6-0276]|uniref:hypothetical protein n=1 Tax=unclassified Paenibacillus TaxID=185978 RepID=UPI0028AC8189|nr:hypothetical protein [Paenibacillus sp.]